MWDINGNHRGDVGSQGLEIFVLFFQQASEDMRLHYEERIKDLREKITAQLQGYEKAKCIVKAQAMVIESLGGYGPDSDSEGHGEGEETLEA